MGISANEDTVESVLSRNYRYTVPDYQRRYAWGEEQWRALWEDVNAIGENDTHFLGSIVVIERSEGLNELSRLEIVDGQQRLATISILLSVIREKYSGNGEYDKHANTIENDYLWDYDLDEERYQNLSLSKFDNDSYRAILQRNYSNIESKQLQEASKFFADKVESLSLSEVDVMRKKILSSLTLVTIECDEEESAFRLFETLNDRGLELSAVDLMKNHLFSIAASSGSVNYNKVQSDWERIIETIVPNLSKPSRFFRHYIMSAPDPDFDDNVSEYKLFDTFKQLINGIVERNDITIGKYISDIREQSKVYVDIANCDIDSFDATGNSAINRKLRQLDDIKSVQARTLFLRTFREIGNPNKLMEALGITESFLMRWKTANYATGSQLDRIYSDICSTSFANDNAIKSVQKYLADQSPSDPEVKAGIENKRVRLNERTKYMLVKLEEKYWGGSIDNPSDYDIEHIAPRASFSAKKYTPWSHYLDTDEATFEQHRDFLGNLTLLESDKNAKIGNSPFENKKQVYRESDSLMTNKIAEEHDDWGIKKISDRTSELATVATSVWSLDSN